MDPRVHSLTVSCKIIFRTTKTKPKKKKKGHSEWVKRCGTDVHFDLQQIAFWEFIIIFISTECLQRPWLWLFSQQQVTVAVPQLPNTATSHTHQ